MLVIWKIYIRKKLKKESRIMHSMNIKFFWTPSKINDRKFSTQIIWKYFFVPYSSYSDKGKWKILFLFHRPTDSYFSNDLPVEQHIKLVSPNVTFDWINIFMKFFHVKRRSPVKIIVLAFFYKIFIFFFFIFIIYLKICLFQIVPLTNIFPKIQNLLGLKNSIKSYR